MNCKPGELAVVVRGSIGLGAVIRCIRLLGTFAPFEPIKVAGRGWHCSVSGGQVWEVEHPLFATASDSCLRPIRDNDGDDETLAWAGKPEKVTA
jgi:hypothetical protein